MRFRQKPLTNIFLSPFFFFLFNVQKMKLWNRQARKENNMVQCILGVGLGASPFFFLTLMLGFLRLQWGGFFSFFEHYTILLKIGPRVVFLNFCSDFLKLSQSPLFPEDYTRFFRGIPDIRETCFNQALKLSPPPKPNQNQRNPSSVTTSWASMNSIRSHHLYPWHRTYLFN